MAVLASADSATDQPCCGLPVAPVPTSLLPCWVQTPPLRVKTQVAPMPELSLASTFTHHRMERRLTLFRVFVW
jgi:hypothetical protein